MACRVDNPFCPAAGGTEMCQCADADNPEYAALLNGADPLKLHGSEPRPMINGVEPGTVMLQLDPRPIWDRERLLERVQAYHENGFAMAALEQGQLLLDAEPDRPAMDALNRRMGRHAAILAELRR